MENQSTETQAVTEFYNTAADLMLNQNKSSQEVMTNLMERGLTENAAYTIVTNLQAEIRNAKKDRAKKDMLYGALWCIGGTIATLANVGFIFWGAILFGGIQFIKGLYNSLTSY